MFGINPYTILVVAILEALLVGGVGWKAYAMGGEHIIATQKREDDIETRTRQAALKVTSEAIAKIEPKNVYRTEKLVTQTVEKPVYRDCVHDDGAFRLLNDTLTAPEDRQEPRDDSVSQADPTH